MSTYKLYAILGSCCGRKNHLVRGNNNEKKKNLIIMVTMQVRVRITTSLLLRPPDAIAADERGCRNRGSVSNVIPVYMRDFPGKN